MKLLEILKIFNDSNTIKNILYTQNGEKATLSLISASKAETFHDLEECVRQSLANIPSVLVRMLKDFPSPENEKDIEFYENDIARYYYGEIQLVRIETISQGNTDSLTLFAIDDLNKSRLSK